MIDKSSEPPRPRRRFLQFSLRTLLVAVAALSVLFGMLGRWLQQVRAEQQAAIEIEKLGAKVAYHWRLDQAISWDSNDNHGSSSWVLPADGYVHAVYLHDAPERVTDEAMVHLKRLVHLRILGLSLSRITDAGMEHLAGLTQLEHLYLRKTVVTESGFEHLKGLKNLQKLDLAFTRFDDAGLRHIDGLANLRDLDLSGTDITDAGLRHLRKLHSLELLILDDTSVTSAAVKQLREALPNAQIARRPSGAKSEMDPNVKSPRARWRFAALGHPLFEEVKHDDR